MTRRLLIALLFFALFNVLLCATSFAQHQQIITPVDVRVRISFDDAKEIPSMLKLQLQTATGALIAEQYVRNEGQVNFQNVYPGSYRLRLSGDGVQEVETEFTVGSREAMHNELLHTVRKSSNDQASSPEGRISAADLNIPDKAKKEFEKGMNSMEKQDYPAAQKHLAKAVEIYPQYSSAYDDLGVIAMHMHQTSEGQGYFEKAIRADSNNGSAYVNLAKVRLMASQYLEAESLLDKSVSLMPTNAEALTLLANTEMQNGKWKLALVNAQKVHTVPHQLFAIAHLIAAQILMRQSEPQAAVLEYKLFLHEAPDSPSASGVRSALQSIEHQTK